ncbi:sulfurtransferase TusA family protein [Peribacillus frigoritolerans]|uniref:sulfurtransferase TusA family protein n=1 Tax=Peribacillus frigoritolerans TaxID=450367 RepID=UPI001059DF36|nr:sulfurtransferase TusA family protein [Peribacillus frigoritolerans]TDL78846.1 sulfurtransferase TusA family protein [Peribacillus frigoritolerans]
MNIDKVLDAKGLACPMPIVKTKKAMNELETGQILEVLTTDKGAKNDLTAWAASTGNEMVDMKEEDNVFVFYIKKG